MGQNIMAVYDSDEAYVTKLMDYFCEVRPVPVEIRGFTEWDALKGFAEENPVDILLVEEANLKDEMEELKFGEIMVLSEEAGTRKDGRGHKNVCKYQSTENIMREVMSYYAEEPEELSAALSGSICHLIGVYSPVRRSLQTSFSLTLGELLSRREKTLYVNMEDYSGFHSLLKESFMSDLSDLVFYVGQNKKNFPYKLASIVQRVGQLDYIPPAIYPTDLKTVDISTWLLLFEKLITSGYGTIIVDFGDGIKDLTELLKICELIYMPVRTDRVSEAKLEQYEASMRIMEQSELLNKTKKLEFPYFRDLDCSPENLEQTSLGDYVRKLLSEGSPWDVGGV
ncbi:MAG: hypothetical protein K5985_09625 [Lachnospiraceae bacterium]|nr:hypothetical protein [Lachnospiraceae bacterium]